MTGGKWGSTSLSMSSFHNRHFAHLGVSTVPCLSIFQRTAVGAVHRSCAMAPLTNRSSAALRVGGAARSAPLPTVALRDLLAQRTERLSRTERRTLPRVSEREAAHLTELVRLLAGCHPTPAIALLASDPVFAARALTTLRVTADNGQATVGLPDLSASLLSLRSLRRRDDQRGKRHRC